MTDDLQLDMASNREVPCLDCRDVAISAYEDGDGIAFAYAGYNNHAMLDLVAANVAPLKCRGIYETALVAAIIGCKHNNRTAPPYALCALLTAGDREKLRTCGDPLPGAGPFQAYRGAAGEFGRRHIAGVSWTSSLDIACWFAVRYFPHATDPAVYSKLLQPDDIFVYSEDRNEQEFLCRVRRPRRLPLTLDEIRSRAKGVQDRREAAALSHST